MTNNDLHPIGRYRGPMPSPWAAIEKYMASPPPLHPVEIGRIEIFRFITHFPYRIRKMMWRDRLRPRGMVFVPGSGWKYVGSFVRYGMRYCRRKSQRYNRAVRPERPVTIETLRRITTVLKGHAAPVTTVDGEQCYESGPL